MTELPIAHVRYKEAQKLADLASIFQDMSFVIEALKRLKKLLEEEGDDHVLIQSHWTGALIAYIRCFSTGKRLGLSEEVFESLEGGVECHRFYKNLRDKHIAHSVNPFEQVVVGLVLSDPSSGGRSIEGVATLSQRLITQTSEGVETLLRLASFAQSTVSKQAKEYEHETLEAGRKLSIDELYSKASLRTVTPGPEDAGRPRR